MMSAPCTTRGKEISVSVPARDSICLSSELRKTGAATKEELLSDGEKRKVCVYKPHSIRARTPTILLDAGVDMRRMQELLGHRHTTIAQIYDKRRRATAENASHEIPI